MKTPSNYQRIASAIDYIQSHFKSQPNLDEVAAHVNLSPFHFQKMFTEWAGVSPKKFLQYLSISHAKSLLNRTDISVQEAAFETGLSGASRLHDLFVNIEGMTPGEYKNGGADLTIHYSFSNTPFGQVLVASTPKGICHMAFVNNEKTALSELKAEFPKAHFVLMMDEHQQNALLIFSLEWHQLQQVKLHLKATDFQLKVWRSLLQIPLGSVSSYGDVAEYIQQPKAARAVGSAIASNSVAYLIPCHRVIQATGVLGQYRWEPTRKAVMLGWEIAHTHHVDD